MAIDLHISITTGYFASKKGTLIFEKDIQET